MSNLNSGEGKNKSSDNLEKEVEPQKDKIANETDEDELKEEESDVRDTDLEENDAEEKKGTSDDEKAAAAQKKGVFQATSTGIMIILGIAGLMIPSAGAVFIFGGGLFGAYKLWNGKNNNKKDLENYKENNLMPAEEMKKAIKNGNVRLTDQAKNDLKNLAKSSNNEEMREAASNVLEASELQEEMEGESDMLEGEKLEASHEEDSDKKIGLLNSEEEGFSKVSNLSADEKESKGKLVSSLKSNFPLKASSANAELLAGELLGKSNVSESNSAAEKESSSNITVEVLFSDDLKNKTSGTLVTLDNKKLASTVEGTNLKKEGDNEKSFFAKVLAFSQNNIDKQHRAGGNTVLSPEGEKRKNETLGAPVTLDNKKLASTVEGTSLKKEGDDKKSFFAKGLAFSQNNIDKQHEAEGNTVLSPEGEKRLKTKEDMRIETNFIEVFTEYNESNGNKVPDDRLIAFPKRERGVSLDAKMKND